MSVAGPSTSYQDAPMERPRKDRRARLGKKEKQKLRDELPPLEPTEPLAAAPLREDGVPDTEEWAWFPLADKQSASCPVLFNPDCSYGFIAVGSTVRIYSVATAELLSTLSLPPSSANRKAKVSSLLLNPSNPLQLVVGALDGMLRLWDYREGTLLRTLALGAPIQLTCGHSSLPHQVFVSLLAEATTEDSDTSEGRAGIYSISLKPRAQDPTTTSPISPLTPRTPSRRMRLAQPRIVRSLSLSPTGDYLISLNPTTINICRTAALQSGFATHLDSPDELTCIAFHPTEGYFATGNTRGQIKLWYGVLEEESSSLAITPKPTTSVFHWHAHAVLCLSFTPNGAYLVSGGEEAVLVLWQLHTAHKEFVPRVGAPITSVSITRGGADEQQILARLRDGSVVFVGAQRLKISKIISGLKADPVRQPDVAHKRGKTQIPLALQPFTKSLVIPAGHPSSLQFYSPSEDVQTLELEVSPSNRVTAVGTPIEPTRVERVAFSTPANGGSAQVKGSYWMATLDAWEAGSFTPERHLKFWQHRPDGSSFALTTRVDRPHDTRITSLSFSPSSTSPILLSTSLDGSIKLWSNQSSSWRCRTSTSYRSFSALDSAWAADGSMFAVAHPKSVSLWALSDGKLIHSFSCTGMGGVTKVEFVGKEGTTLLAAGKNSTTAWNLLTYEETFTALVEASTLSIRPESATFFATERPAWSPQPSNKPGRTDTYLVDPVNSSLIHRTLPFPVRQTIFLDPILATSDESGTVTLAVVDDKGDVILVGGETTARFEKQIAPTRLNDELTTQTRLFEEIFGKVAEVESASKVVIQVGEKKRTLGSGLEALDAPAHTLPPPRLLWRSMLGNFASVTTSKTVEKGRPEAEEEATKMDVDSSEPVAEVYSSVSKLMDVFKARFSLSAAAPPANK